MYGVFQPERVGSRLISLVAALVAGLVGCTDPATRTRIMVLVDADSEVRAEVVEVEVRVESRRGKTGGWHIRTTQRFDADVVGSWPVSFRLEPEAGEDELTYQLLATARDSRAAVVAQARVLADFTQASRDGLRVLFEASCLRRSELCGSGMTCSGGACVSAIYDPSAPPTRGARNDAGLPPDMMMPAPSASGIAQEGEACDLAGERRCAGFGSPLPLLCEASSWRRAPECPAAQRCDTSDGPTRGTCRPIARECLGQQPNVAFCSAETMRVCNADLVASMIRPCSENMRCAPDQQGEASCACRAGFIKGSDGCEEAKSCTKDNGGCDPLTTCSESSGGRRCSMCPPGFSGDGDSGCVPLLTGLTLSDGELNPVFTSMTTSYRVKVPLLVQRVTLSASVPQAARISVNGDPMPSGESWTSPVLMLGENEFEVAVSTEFGVSKAYRVIVERAGAQEAYIKASNTAAGQYFAAVISLSGDTLVVGAPYESGAASGVNADQSPTGARNAGAAYVFVRSDGVWKQQAYLKARNASAGDFFGGSVGVSGDTIAVGGVRQNLESLTDLPTRTGLVSVFTRTAGVWSLQGEVSASDGAPGDAFGYALTLDKDTLVVGAILEGPVGARGGAAYVFTRKDASWTESQKLMASENHELSLFGGVMSMEGDTLAISAHEDGSAVRRGGAVYVFTRRAGRFVQTQRLQPEPPVENAMFGFASDVHGEMLVVGGPGADLPNRTDEPGGSVWLYERSGERWAQNAVLTNPLASLADTFGTGVALGDGAILVGAAAERGSSRGLSGDPTQRDRPAGAAYLFARTDDGWKPSTYFKASNAGPQDDFGWVVALSGDVAVVGARSEDSSAKGINANGEDDASENAGAVYVFH